MMHFFTRILLGLACALWLVIPAASQAQDRDTTATTDTTAALPDIAPREVEIRGEMEATFPDLQRQPLIGFNPPPRVPTLTGDRRPFIGTYRQETADLPGSPLRQPDAPARFISPDQPLLGEGEITTGRYFDRRIYLRTSVPVQERISLSGRFDYQGTEGHNPFENDAISAAADRFSGRLGLRARGRLVTGGVEAHGLYSDYDLFGTGDFYFDQLPDPSTFTMPARKGQGVGGAAWIGSRGGGLLSFTARAEASTVQFDTYGLSADPTFEAGISQQRAQGEIGASLNLQDMGMLKASAAYEVSQLESTTLYDGTVQRFDAGALASTQIRRSVTLEAGVRAFGFIDEADATTLTTNRHVYLAPAIRADWYPSQGLQFYAHQNPGTTAHSVEDLFRSSPFQVAEPRVQPSVRLIDAEVGVRTYFGPAQFAAHVAYKDMPFMLVYESMDDGTVAPAYEEANITQAGANVSVVLPAGFHAAVSGQYRYGELTGQQPPGVGPEPSIPYFSPVAATAALSWSFDERNGLLQVEGLFESERYTDRSETTMVDHYVSLNASASYHVTHSVAILGRMDNILSNYSERWAHYPEAPLSVSLGLRIRW